MKVKIKVNVKVSEEPKPLKKDQLLLLAGYLEEIRSNIPKEIDFAIGFAAHALKMYATYGTIKPT